MQVVFKDFQKIRDFEESCRLDTLREKLMAKKPEKVEKIVKAKESEQKKVPPITNHVQRDLTLFITQLLSFGYDIQTIKDNLLRNGYRASDIRVAMMHIPILEKHSPVKLSKEQEEFLGLLKKEGPMATTLVYRRLQLSPRKGNNMKDYLMESKLIAVEGQKLHNCRVKNLLLTDRGAKLAKSY